MSEVDEIVKIYDENVDDSEWVAASRAELAALRAKAALLDDYAETIRMHEIKIAEQARQLSEARDLLTTLEWNDCEGPVHHYRRNQQETAGLAVLIHKACRCFPRTRTATKAAQFIVPEIRVHGASDRDRSEPVAVRDLEAI